MPVLAFIHNFIVQPCLPQIAKYSISCKYCCAVTTSVNFVNSRVARFKSTCVSTNVMNKMCFDVYVSILVCILIFLDSPREYIFYQRTHPFLFSHRFCSVKSSPDRDSNPGSALQQQGALTMEFKTFFQFSKPTLILLGLMYVCTCTI